jgi:molybdenum storage protein
MAIIHGEGIERTDIDTAFQHISFTHADAENLASKTPVVRILPEVNVLKLGGQSMMDRGRSAVVPVLDEICEIKDKYPVLLGVGGGTRARHAYSVALDLGLPTSILAKLGMAVPMQNARMLLWKAAAVLQAGLSADSAGNAAL